MKGNIMLKILVVLMAGLFAIPAFADTETATESVQFRDVNHGIIVLKVAFLCDDSDGACATEAVNINGYILKVDTDPGSTAPTDNYNITFISSIGAGIDVMGGELANRDTANSESAIPKIGNAYGAVYARTVTITPTNNLVNDATFDVYITILTANYLWDWN